MNAPLKLAALCAALCLAFPAQAQTGAAPIARVITDGNPDTPDDLAFTLPLRDGETLADIQLLEAGQATSLATRFQATASAGGLALKLATPLDLDRFIGHSALLRVTVSGPDGPRQQDIPLAIAGPDSLPGTKDVPQSTPDGAADFLPLLPLEQAGNLTLRDIRDAAAQPLPTQTLTDGTRSVALAGTPVGTTPPAGGSYDFSARYVLSPSGRELQQTLRLTPVPASRFSGEAELTLDTGNGQPRLLLADAVNLDLRDLATRDGRAVLDRFDAQRTADGRLALTLKAGQSLDDLSAPLELIATRSDGRNTLTQTLRLAAASATSPVSTQATAANPGTATGSITGKLNGATGSAGAGASGSSAGTLPATGNSTGTSPAPATAPKPPGPAEPPRAATPPRAAAITRPLSGNISRYEYDPMGNPTARIDPLGNATRTQWDPLYRPRTQTLPAGTGEPVPVITTGYDALDRLIAVTDPRNLTTTYGYDTLGSVTSLQSPDTGTTRTLTDGASNPQTRTDARGQARVSTYDALDRLTGTTWPGATGNELARLIYTWDSPRIGRLGSVEEQDANGQRIALTTTTWDTLGRIASETRSLGNLPPATTAYTWGPGGRLLGVTLPSGRSLGYAYDAAGRITAITSTWNGVTRTLVSGVTYTPFGGIRSYTLGNGQTLTRTLDSEGRLTALTLAGAQLAYRRDGAGRILAITDSADAARNVSFSYDAQGRLTTATHGNKTWTYRWDVAGNRLARTLQTVGGSGTTTATDSLTPAATSNRIASITPAGGSPRTQNHDAMGNLTGDSTRSFDYDARGRLTRAILAAAGSTPALHQIDAFGRRVRKNAGQPGDTVYHYDRDGHLIAESAPDGSRLKEIIWLHDLPVAVLLGGAQ